MQTNSLKIPARKDSGPVSPELPTRRSEGGFTLVEVMIALAIVALTAVVILDRRVDIVRDAARAREMRTGWSLVSQKLGELELDKKLWTGLGSQSNGDFSELHPDYALYTWEYRVERWPVDVSDPSQTQQQLEKPRELLRLTLAVRSPGLDEPIIVEGMFPIYEPKAPGTDASKDPQNPQNPQDPTQSGAPLPGGKKQ